MPKHTPPIKPERPTLTIMNIYTKLFDILQNKILHEKFKTKNKCCSSKKKILPSNRVSIVYVSHNQNGPKDQNKPAIKIIKTAGLFLIILFMVESLYAFLDQKQ